MSSIGGGMRLNDLLKREDDDDLAVIGIAPRSTSSPVPPPRHRTEQRLARVQETLQTPSAFTDKSGQFKKSQSDISILVSDESQPVADEPERPAAGMDRMQNLLSKAREKGRKAKEYVKTRHVSRKRDGTPSSANLDDFGPPTDSAEDLRGKGEESTDDGAESVSSRSLATSIHSSSLPSTKGPNDSSETKAATVETEQAPVPPSRRRSEVKAESMSVKRRPSRSSSKKDAYVSLPWFEYRVACAILLMALTWIFPNFLIGFLWGIYLCALIFIYTFVSAPEALAQELRRDEEEMTEALNAAVVVDANDNVKVPLEQALSGTVYKGWMNQLRLRYDPNTYTINRTRSVLLRLDGAMLRIGRVERNIFKHGFYGDPSLKGTVEKQLCGQSIYDLTGANICLRPRQLARRRWWSRKYPICIEISVDAEVTSCGLGGKQRRSAGVRKNKSKTSLNLTGSDVNGQQTSTSVTETKRQSASSLLTEETESSSDAETPIEDDGHLKLPRSERLTETMSLNAISLEKFEEAEKEMKGKKLKKRRRKRIYLFARCAREKERWFHRLRQASLQNLTDRSLADSGSGVSESTTMTRSSSMMTGLADDVEEDSATGIDVGISEFYQYLTSHRQFERCMSDLFFENITAEDCDPSAPSSTAVGGGSVSSSSVWMDLGRMECSSTEPDCGSDTLVALNSLATRIFYDFSRDGDWIDRVQERIQRKLSTIRLPYFIETLSVTKLDVGRFTPRITGVRKPFLNDWGLWIDLDIHYSGRACLQLKTKVNLMKIKDAGSNTPIGGTRHKLQAGAEEERGWTDSDLPESPESSPDEDSVVSLLAAKRETTPGATDQSKGSRSAKFLSLVDRVAQNKYFQDITELKIVKGIMEGISATPLMLNVELSGLTGTLAVNVPPPPSDRVWYSFRRPPQLTLRAVPRVGERTVDVSPVSEWIEQRLRTLIDKNLVVPNMDDVPIPLMSGNRMLNMGRYNE